ncbi:MAG: prepilin-type N-terminal cleavage/methylation domain-containing protein [Nitrospirota bacterium]
MIETGEKGFTLVEVLVAMAIFTFGMLAVLGMLVVSMNGGAEGRQITEATNLAASKIEDLKLTDYSKLVSQGGTVFSDTTTVSSSSVSDKFTRTWEIYTSVAVPLNLAKAVVTTSWTAKGNSNKTQQHSVTIQTLISK